MTEETHDSKLLGWSFSGPYLNLGSPNCESRAKDHLGDATKFCRSSNSGRIKGYVGKTPSILDVTTVTPRLTTIIRSRITIVSRNLR